MRGTGLKLLFLGAIWAPLAATAGDWTLNNSVQLNTYATDNMSQRSNSNAGVVARLTPRIGLQGKGARISGKLSYAPTVYTAMGDDPPDSGLNHNLAASFNSMLVRDQLFLDADASAGLVTVNTSAGAGSGGDTEDTRQTYTFSLSPYTQHRFGDLARMTVRLGFNTLQGESEADVLSSTELSGQAVLSSGQRFTRFPWSISAGRREVSFSGRDDTRDTADATLGYRWNTHWRVDGQVGYQKYTVGTSRTDTVGSTYSGTVYWTPNPRTSLEAQLGQRYFGTYWRVNGSHQTRRTTLRFNARREVTNTRSQIFNAVSLGELARRADVPIDPDLEDLLLIQTSLLDEDYLNTRFGMSMSVNGRRSRLNGSVNWSKREYEVSARGEDVFGFTLGASRDLARGYTGRTSFSWQDVQSELSGDSQYWQMSLGLSHSLGRYTRIGLDLTRRERTTSGTGSEPFTEHRIGLVLSTRMF